MQHYQFTAHIERDRELNLYVGYIPNLPGAQTQAETLDELHENLIEVAQLVLESLEVEEVKSLQNEFIGTQEVRLAI